MVGIVNHFLDGLLAVLINDREDVPTGAAYSWFFRGVTECVCRLSEFIGAKWAE